MKTRTLAIIPAAVMALGAPAATIEPLGMSSYKLDWDGAANEAYFIQWSLDLGGWQYFPLVDQGVDHDEFNFNSSTDRFFVRVVSWPYTGTDPHGADFDGDGLSNIFELMFGLDPLDTDSDDDGILDGAEDLDEDGALNTTENFNGSNPKVKDHPDVKLSVTVGN